MKTVEHYPINEALEIVKRFLKLHTTHKIETAKLNRSLISDFICEVEDQSGEIQKINFWIDEINLSFGKGKEKFTSIKINDLK